VLKTVNVRFARIVLNPSRATAREKLASSSPEQEDNRFETLTIVKEQHASSSEVPPQIR
jgi:hypothetical protein